MIEPAHAEEGALSQVKVLKLQVFDGQTKEATLKPKLELVVQVPIVQANTPLTFSLPEPVVCNRATVELYQNYGGSAIGLAKVTFFR